MLTFIDTYDKILQMRRRYLNNEGDLLTLWKDYLFSYEAILCHCLADTMDYNFEQEIAPILHRALTTDFHMLEVAHQSYIQQANDIQSKFTKLFQLTENIDVYFYIGLCNGAGWATFVNNRHTVLIGAEKIVELGWQDTDKMNGLQCHELCHIAHSLLRKESLHLPNDHLILNDIWKLYVEGFAERYSQRINEDGVYSERGLSWTTWCKTNHQDLAQEYLKRIKCSLGTEDFYGDWNNYKGYSDVGYFLGCEFIRHLGNTYTLQEIATLKLSSLKPLVIKYLNNL